MMINQCGYYRSASTALSPSLILHLLPDGKLTILARLGRFLQATQGDGYPGWLDHWNMWAGDLVPPGLLLGLELVTWVPQNEGRPTKRAGSFMLLFLEHPNECLTVRHLNEYHSNIIRD